MRRWILTSGTMVLLIGCHPDSPTQPGGSDAEPAFASGAPPITLTFMCGKTFRLRNPTDSTLVVAYDVYQTTERATLSLRPRASGSAYSETFFVTQNKGTVRVFSNGVLAQTKANGGFACTGNRRLRVVQYQGVTGGPLTPSASYPAGASVSYSFSALQGYQNLTVVLDGRLVPASGTFKMDNDHTLLVGADRRAELQPGDEALVASAKAIITSPDPVAAYQGHLDGVGALFDQVGEAEASRRLAAVNFLAFDPLTDAAAIRRASLALANHEFLVRQVNGGAQLQRSGALSTSSMESEEREPTTIRYVNGILSNQGRVAEAARRLLAITHEAGLDDANVKVTHFYNQTFSDPVETLAQRRTRCLQDGVESSGFLNEISRLLRWVRCVDEGINYLIGTFDLVEASRQYISVVSGLPLGAETDAGTLGQLIQADRANDRHVILVPHSQGNLITQLALLRPPPGSLDPALGVCVAALPLAAPTAANWQLPANRLAPVQVSRDIILLTPSSHFPAIDTDSSIKAGNEIATALANANAGGDGGGTPLSLSIYWGVKLHQLLDSYFPAPQSRQAIADGLRTLYKECAIGYTLTDSFTDTDGTLLGDHIPDGGDFRWFDQDFTQVVIRGGRLTSSLIEDPEAPDPHKPGATVMELPSRIDAEGGYAEVGIEHTGGFVILRLQSIPGFLSGSGYGLQLSQETVDGPFKLYLHRITGGGEENIASPIEVGSPSSLRIAYHAGVVYGYMNGSLVFQVADAAHTSFGSVQIFIATDHGDVTSFAVSNVFTP